MKRLFLLACGLLAVTSLFAQGKTRYPPVALDTMTQFFSDDSWTESVSVIALKQKDSTGEVTTFTKRGFYYAEVFKYNGTPAKRPKPAQVLKFYASAIKKQKGKVIYQDATRLDAQIPAEGWSYWINVAIMEDGRTKLIILSDATPPVVDEVPVDG
ncbi:hypothetical protein MKQ68_05260 [Chitinophaga horti]|uniref:Beta-lactamase-inhibitor-like PepSY-like domain-containing protein n=1 Tax=Chitinophaga horti TaxID=2920382 RepID=A0ABY6J4H6_9BACT|nr:hypothetical protein [Chitinophaga horti]UYQ94498.1 hypothetical protein MKQ68_05260 [Chitinophaga horti]